MGGFFFFDVMNRLLDWSMTLIFCWVTNTQKKCWIENLSVVHLYHELRLPRLGWIWQPIVENRLYGSLTLLKINLLIFKALGFFFLFQILTIKHYTEHVIMCMFLKINRFFDHDGWLELKFYSWNFKRYLGHFFNRHIFASLDNSVEWVVM